MNKILAPLLILLTTPCFGQVDLDSMVGLYRVKGSKAKLGALVELSDFEYNGVKLRAFGFAMRNLPTTADQLRDHLRDAPVERVKLGPKFILAENPQSGKQYLCAPYVNFWEECRELKQKSEVNWSPNRKIVFEIRDDHLRFSMTDDMLIGPLFGIPVFDRYKLYKIE